MPFGVCRLSIVPCREEPSDKSQMVTQLLFGEYYEVLEEQERWLRIKIADDGYECWINRKQSTPISNDEYIELETSQPKLLLDQTATITHLGNPVTIVMGSVLHDMEGLSIAESKGSNLIAYSKRYLGVPYSWGGRSPFGIDCSGFTQIAFRLCGKKLPRDSNQQAKVGESINLKEQEVGDLAFFKDKNGDITHVGIVLEEEKIIHASGTVRIDKLDQKGILNEELDKYTHDLYTVKRIV